MIYDRRLTDPDPKTLLAAVSDAVKVANASRGRRSAEAAAEPWREAVIARADPDGVLTSAEPGGWDPRGAIFIAWWTDTHGRQTVRLFARRSLPFLPSPWPRNRPPLWWVFPDRVHLRSDGEPHLVAGCACGVCGRPEELGWTGPRCGPCDDHRQEQAALRLPLPAEPRTALWAEADRGLQFSPGGRWLAGLGSRSLTCWEVATGESEWVDDFSRPPGVVAFDFSANGDWLLCLTETGSVTRRPVGDWQAPAEVVGSAAEGRGLVSLPDGRVLVADVLRPRLATHPWPRGRYFWDDATGTTACDPSPHILWQREATGTLFASPAGGQLALLTHPGVRILDGSTGEELGVLPVSRDVPLCAAFSPDGRRLVTGGAAGRVTAWSVPDGRRLVDWECHFGAVAALALSPDGRTLATVGEEGYLKLWPWADLLAAEGIDW
jgi:hypothetical protein